MKKLGTDCMVKDSKDGVKRHISLNLLLEGKIGYLYVISGHNYSICSFYFSTCRWPPQATLIKQLISSIFNTVTLQIISNLFK